MQKPSISLSDYQHVLHSTHHALQGFRGQVQQFLVAWNWLEQFMSATPPILQVYSYPSDQTYNKSSGIRERDVTLGSRITSPLILDAQVVLIRPLVSFQKSSQPLAVLH